MDIGRVEGHSSRLLAAIAAGVQGRRDRWLWALGLQLPPGPHSPVVHLQQDQHQGDNDDDNHHNGSHDGSRALIQGVLSPGHVQREDGVPQSGGCGHLAPVSSLPRTQDTGSSSGPSGFTSWVLGSGAGGGQSLLLQEEQ